MKKLIRLTEGELHQIVEGAVKRVLKESEGFDSKEDMKQDRDMYTEPPYDWYRPDYDVDSGPYKNYKYHYFDDDYDYCGDDDYNEKVGDYNRNLKKKLATKGGQMRNDWHNAMIDDWDAIRNQHARLNADYDKRVSHEKWRQGRNNRLSKADREHWFNGGEPGRWGGLIARDEGGV